ncbi:MAG: DUF5615 family PIN-like protein, partial [Roseiflexaceae bacterium]
MLRLATDENFDGTVFRGVLRRKPELDIVRIQDAGLSGNDDPTVLDWAAQEGRILITHDVTTITHFAYERIRAGQSMPGIFEVNLNGAIVQIIEDILLLVECSFDGEYEGQI